ncbi:hypothetical protein D9M70_268110 [compost metagenome]
MDFPWIRPFYHDKRKKKRELIVELPFVFIDSIIITADERIDDCVFFSHWRDATQHDPIVMSDNLHEIVQTEWVIPIAMQFNQFFEDVAGDWIMKLTVDLILNGLRDTRVTERLVYHG